MPTYVYECSVCEQVFEVDQRISEDLLTDCPKCDAKASLKRLIQPTAVMFKGSGFYVNDSSSKSATTPAKKEESTPTDSKPAAPAASDKASD